MFKKIITLVLISCCLLPVASRAFSLEPLYATLKPAGRDAEQTFQIKNPGSNPIAIEFRITTREQNIDGKEHRVAADDQFMVYPTQAIVQPGEVQKVRVQWLGNVSPKKELAFRLIAEQLPINLEKDPKTGLKMVMTMIGSIYIRPDNTQSQLQIIEQGMRGQQYQLTIANQGTAHALLEGLHLTLDNGQTLSGDAVSGAEGQNILAGVTRVLSIPVPPGNAQVTGIQFRQ